MPLKHLLLWFITSALTSSLVPAELIVPKIFSDGMVIQRDRPIHVWGITSPGENVRVILGARDLSVRAGKDGKWSMELAPIEASSQAISLTIRSAGQTVEYDNILVGDVWLLGGQSNMEDVLESIYHGDTEVISANFPAIRLMTIPQQATAKPEQDIKRINEFNGWTNRYELKGQWRICTPKSVARFSAIGYIFGRRLHMVSGVPIGLIDASVGGTTVEAWTSRAKLAGINGAKPLIDEWDSKISEYDAAASLAAKIRNWEKDTERRRAKGEKPNPKPTEPAQDPASDRNNPGASYNAMIAPVSGFNIRGALFNQGYNNALGNARPQLYRQTFQAMIEDWRSAFRDPDLPFAVIGLTPGGQPQTLDNFELRMVDPAPYIREAQHAATRSLKNTAYLPAYDQQVPWYHPHKKFELGERAARWALNTCYHHKNIGWKPVELIAAENRGDHFELVFEKPVRVHDGRPFSGFAIAGENQHFVPATAEFVVTGQDKHKRDQHDEKRLKVSSPLVKKPVAVRYAWSRNPLGNAVNSAHHERTIPIPSFRTDNWDWPEAPFAVQGNDAENSHREAIRDLRNAARDNNTGRLQALNVPEATGK
ncbi:MAG: sialate O-acetylesterase [Verrucomicrobiota bacterium]|nr:sialate O-acetylesterase [Verrucomicrobiota bacterium]